MVISSDGQTDSYLDKIQLLQLLQLDKKHKRPTKDLAKARQTKNQSAVNRYCTASGFDGILEHLVLTCTFIS